MTEQQSGKPKIEREVDAILLRLARGFPSNRSEREMQREFRAQIRRYVTNLMAKEPVDGSEAD